MIHAKFGQAVVLGDLERLGVGIIGEYGFAPVVERIGGVEDEIWLEIGHEKRVE